MARILLAEDYDDLRDMISEMLRSQEHVVEAFENGHDAQLSLQRHNFDLMILDWDLPKVQGIDICKNHRSTGGTTPILMLTGKKDVNDKEAGFDAGADDYLTKPFHPKELIARIKALLRRTSTTSGEIPIGELPQGTVFMDRYEVVQTLGRGSTGIIYKAKHVYLNRPVALKILHPQLVAEKESVTRFKQEAEAISTLSHPNIIEVHDFGITPEGLPYLVMNFSGGETLMNRITSRNHLSPEEALPLFIQTCDALSHAHARGVIHRDVKPGNMLIIEDDGGQELLKLVDFGIAKFARGGDAMRLTQNGDVLGSPLYMSPEQCMGAPLDARTDIFSLGCVMYTALMGFEPFMGENILETMYRRTVESPPSFAQMRPDIDLPQALEVITFRALARDVNDRYQTMADLKRDLERLSCALA